MSKLENLQPQKVFEYFEQIAAIPHGSRDTKAISDYLVSFAKERGLECYQDELNNVVIIQEASAGYEACDPIIIQGHMDMVCEKEKDCNIDFSKDGLDLYVDGDFLKARGTTLGGDDGIAVAYALAIMDSPEIVHPRLEVVITVDEEIGMLGAADINLDMLKGHTMLNIDSDIEGHFLTSCAGGMSLNITIPVSRFSKSGVVYELCIGGLDGGHSGSEIDKEHGNADIIMGRFLKMISEEFPFGIVKMAGGLKDNAIPRECNCTILIPEGMDEALADITKELDGILKNEYLVSDKNVFASATRVKEDTAEILDFASVNKLVFFLRSVPNGVINMSTVMNGLVETSLNLGILELREDSAFIVISVRSSVSSRKIDLASRVYDIVSFVGGECVVEGDYPAWEYKNESPLRVQMAEAYKNLFGNEPVFEAIHAGLECGILSDKIPNLDCVSFGPDNFDIHTPKERLSISSTERVWKLLIEFLKNCK